MKSKLTYKAIPIFTLYLQDSYIQNGKDIWVAQLNPFDVNPFMLGRAIFEKDKILFSKQSDKNDTFLIVDRQTGDIRADRTQNIEALGFLKQPFAYKDTIKTITYTLALTFADERITLTKIKD